MNVTQFFSWRAFTVISFKLLIIKHMKIYLHGLL